MLEVKAYRAELESAIYEALDTQIQLTTGQVTPTEWDGLYRWKTADASAELEVETDTQGKIQVKGIAFWGTNDVRGPNIGEVDCVAVRKGDRLIAKSDGYHLEMVRTSSGIVVNEHESAFGLNVTFAGAFSKIPAGSEVVPQPPPMTFESEFWPEEGIPVYQAQANSLQVFALPDRNSKSLGFATFEIGDEITFDGFRYRTIRPGKLETLKPNTLRARNLGLLSYISRDTYYDSPGEEIEIELRPGDTIEYLQYRAEGTGFLRWRGLVLDAEINSVSFRNSLKEVVEPVAQGWLRIPFQHGMGWIPADETIREVDRRF